MAVALERFKNYLRIDGDFEDDLLSQFLQAAESTLKGAISKYEQKYQADSAFADKADILHMIIAGDLYQNRDSRNDSRQNYSFTVQTMMNQLKYWVSDTDTTTTTTYTTAADLGGEPP